MNDTDNQLWGIQERVKLFNEQQGVEKGINDGIENGIKIEKNAFVKACRSKLISISPKLLFCLLFLFHLLNE